MALQPQWARASSLSRLRNLTQTHHTLWKTFGQVISLMQIPLPNNTRHSQQTHIHAPGGIRTRNPSKPTATDTHDLDGVATRTS